MKMLTSVHLDLQHPRPDWDFLWARLHGCAAVLPNRLHFVLIPVTADWDFMTGLDSFFHRFMKPSACRGALNTCGGGSDTCMWSIHQLSCETLRCTIHVFKIVSMFFIAL